MLKGPERIPLPEVLKQRGGRGVVSLKCAVAIDGSSQVSVMDSSGMVALDENLQKSFSNLPWYPGEENGKPVAVVVRLIIEASWNTGDEVIQWKGRIPR